jgi:flavorubredoxin
LIAPSHGPIHDRPGLIMDAYRRWASDKAENLAVIAYVSMHGSTQIMVDHLIEALADRGVRALKFDLTVTDLGKAAEALVDAATLVIGTPAFNGGPHPHAAFFASLVSGLRPKLKQWAMIGSYGWGARVAEQLTAQLEGLKIESLGTIQAKGLPGQAEFAALDDLANAIQHKHQEMNEG